MLCRISFAQPFKGPDPEVSRTVLIYVVYLKGSKQSLEFVFARIKNRDSLFGAYPQLIFILLVKHSTVLSLRLPLSPDHFCRF